jgi:predicted MPP superfamily phosphohydrolase
MAFHMPRIPWRFIPVIVLLFALVLGVSFYVIDRLSGLLSMGGFWLSVAIALAFTILLPTVMFLPGIAPNVFTNTLWVVISTVFGIMFSALSALLVFELLNLLMDLPAFTSGLVIVFFVLWVAAISFVNAQQLVVRKVRIERFPRRLKAVQLSDLHIGSVHGTGYLKRVVDTVNKAEPDVVLITGDIMSGATRLKKGMFDELNRIKANIFMVPGNHEYYDGIDEILEVLSTTKVKVLRDEVIEMDGYRILGLDFQGEKDDDGGILEELASDGRPVIALSHVPRMIKLPAGSVILSGHYHAGQIFPFNLLVGRLRYGKGLFEEESVFLYVSPGSATWGPPMRFGSKNEVTLLELGT